jgi:hypothetical protein
MTATHHQKHQAGRHLIVAQALLMGSDAQIVGRSTFVEINGHRAEVRVATTGTWQIANVDRFLSATTPRVVFVDLSGTVPDFFILDGDGARATVKRHHEEFLTRVGGVRPRNPHSKHAALKRDHVQHGLDRWSLFD